jgi:hypothetical protein
MDTGSLATEDSEEEPERKWGVHWKLVASTLDMFFFLIFCVLNVVVCVVTSFLWFQCRIFRIFKFILIAYSTVQVAH